MDAPGSRPPSGMGKVIILHEWDGKPYFQALEAEVKAATGEVPLYRELWFIRQMAIGLVRRQPVLIRKSLRNLLFFFRSFALRDATIVLGMAPFDPSMVFWSRLRKANRVFYHTSWLTWEGDDVPKRPLVFKGFIRARWKRFIEDPRVRVVSVLKESRPSIQKRYRKEDAAFTAIPHAVDLSAFRPPVAPSPPPLEPAKLRVVYLGRLNSRKGIDVVAELIATADADRFHFGVAGDGPEWSRLEPLRDRFEYHGFVEGKTEVARILGGYDVLILPSFFEPFGIAFVEAMACGVVCIASDGLFPRDLIVDGENGFIVKRTREAFLGALEILHGDRDRLARFRERGLERAREFDLNAIGARWKKALWDT